MKGISFQIAHAEEGNAKDDAGSPEDNWLVQPAAPGLADALIRVQLEKMRAEALRSLRIQFAAAFEEVAGGPTEEWGCFHCWKIWRKHEEGMHLGDPILPSHPTVVFNSFKPFFKLLKNLGASDSKAVALEHALGSASRSAVLNIQREAAELKAAMYGLTDTEVVAEMIRRKIITSSGCVEWLPGSDTRGLITTDGQPRIEGKSYSRLSDDFTRLRTVRSGSIAVRIHEQHIARLRQRFLRTRGLDKLHYIAFQLCETVEERLGISARWALYCEWKARVFAVALRYELRGGVLAQSACPKGAMLALENEFGVNHEGFGSPFNAHFDTFGSAYPDVDAVFGSTGDFFTYPSSNHYAQVVNPPFMGNKYFKDTLDHLEQELATSALPMTIVLVGAAHGDWLDQVQASPYVQRIAQPVPVEAESELVSNGRSNTKREHVRDGVQILPGARWKPEGHVYRCFPSLETSESLRRHRSDTAIIVLQNKHAKPATAEGLANVVRGFRTPSGTSDAERIGQCSTQQHNINGKLATGEAILPSTWEDDREVLHESVRKKEM